MKNLFTCLMAAGLFYILSGCGTACINGNGNRTTEGRQLGTFSSIDAGGAYDLILTQDPNQSLEIEADANLLEHIKTEVRNGTLHISTENPICDGVTIRISMAELEELSASGALEVETVNKFITKRFSLDASGAVEADLQIEADEIRTELSGAGEIIYRGKTGSHRVDMSGAGELEAFDLIAESYDIDVSGAAECAVHVLKELDVSGSGASSIRYKGDPAVVNQHISGAGSVKKVP